MMYPPAADFGMQSGVNMPAYGGASEFNMAYGTNANVKPARIGHRKTMNIVSMSLSLFVPWILFSVLYGVLSFNIHFDHPAIATLICAVGFVLVCAFGVLAASALKRKYAGDPTREPTWFVFLFVSCLVAWITAVVFGDMNFHHNAKPFYDLYNLNVYPSVDPSKWRGQQLMDAGRIMFEGGSKLDLKRTAGFKNTDMYCVAPIVMDGQAAASYDFWAVGMNCCDGMDTSSYRCGDYDNVHARGGLRLMHDDERPFYRLAVQEAESAYNIQATHPLFFYWLDDPIASMSQYQDNAYKWFLAGMFLFFTVQLTAVAAASIFFSQRS